MHLLFRTFLVWLRRNRRGLDVHDVGRISFRVLPTDLDVLGHMNNGVYLSIMDLGRMDLMQRSGVLPRLMKAGFYPVMADETISFRRSLQPWQRFSIETRIVGYDEKAVYVEQRAVAGGEIYARATMRSRFVRKTGGTVSTAELASVAGIDISGSTLPAWVTRWAADVALPPARGSAPSEWD
ncbi:acyl-CoA thioesterase [Lacisediminihabitans profunda]|uniref:Thioesterase n=1 Tax=Lacisediminihabitans profunda TaxID=2594790 RepID=A0A5C8UPX4_9MICO|nr:acyl-CoA thioesterase [Lacisediminihabitans profunda]TXN29404.1 thioesterase [Lacisediminihabitans profunda]